jgi:hypothetical protein
LQSDVIVVLLKIGSFEVAAGSQLVGHDGGLSFLSVGPSGNLDFGEEVYPGVVVLLVEALVFLELRFEAGLE